MLEDRDDPFSRALIPPERAQEIERLTRLTERLGASFTATFAKGVADGKRFDAILQQMGRSLVEIGLKAALAPLQQTLSRGVAGLLGGIFHGGSGAGGLAGGGFPPLPPVRPFAKGGVVAAPTYFPMAGGLGLMGERGAEAILPLARGADGRLGVRAGAGEGRAPTIVVNIQTPDAESFRRSEAQVSASLARAVARGRRAS
ncbi:phage tail tape measure protein [Salinarimonas ramus]|uniref:Tail protein n=1 Tax=Salinarimonas ramus TaxID=690164 RepID=A0A917V3B9_9HYPH|nr:phage tail tape measure protein [Salinarimonas ramus]GGK29800.1 tail protein [Salinarimonas ramus]